MGVPEEIKTDNGPAYVSQRLTKFILKWGVRHITGIPHSPIHIGQAIVERANCTLKEYLEKQKQSEDLDVAKQLNRVLFALNYLSLTEGREELPVSIHHATIKENRPQAIPGLQVYYEKMKTENGKD